MRRHGQQEGLRPCAKGRGSYFISWKSWGGLYQWHVPEGTGGKASELSKTDLLANLPPLSPPHSHAPNQKWKEKGNSIGVRITSPWKTDAMCHEQNTDQGKPKVKKQSQKEQLYPLRKNVVKAWAQTNRGSGGSRVQRSYIYMCMLKCMCIYRLHNLIKLFRLVLVFSS